ncbi:hypothetical protein OBBRIDRAFT_383888 [Obba rivulosa]|uniref:Uncharacterized protein n=1 Tax=Obba rivulosa TaxID=1052685 RepID=A0A8E2DF86_9APHY|nr:hypothetical protein OBBRIDRAFT_383888 [Obba rivulosa]
MEVSDQTASITQGFAPGPDARGTMDIVWPCVSAVILCTWIVQDSGIQKNKVQAASERFFMACLMIIAPEIALTIALREFLTARHVVSECNEHWKARGSKIRWSMVEGFYACMGGFTLDGKKSLTSKDIRSLVYQGFITPKSYADDIQDRSKTDALMMFITYFQALWLVTQCIVRVVGRLPITTLEFNAVGYVIVSCAIHILKWHRPHVVPLPISMSLPRDRSVEGAVRALEKIDVHVGEKHQDIETPPMTPLSEKSSEVEDDAQAMSRDIRGRECPAGSSERLQVHFAWLLCCIVGVGFGIWHCVAWNNFFPTHTEQQLWRICSILSAIPYMPLVAALNWKESLGSSDERQRNKLLHHFCNLLIGSVLFLYIFARGVLLVEVFIGLRRMPAQILVTIQWPNFLPHM